LNGFTLVKESVSAREVAERYGLKVNRHGMGCCPFHDDTKPSMKLDRRFFCFGCGATGDSIDLAGMLLGLSPYESMRQLAQDFGVTIINPSIKKAAVIAQNKTDACPQDMKKWTTKAVRVLLRYRDYLRVWNTAYSPDKAEDEWNPCFEEALAMQDKVAYWLDVLLFGEEHEKEILYEDLKSEVEELENRFCVQGRNIRRAR